jgi:hypothetical protein
MDFARSVGDWERIPREIREQEKIKFLAGMRADYNWIFVRIGVLLLLSSCGVHAQFYAGAAAGVSTLSADGRSEVTPTAASLALYKPENGPAVNAYAGLHLSDLFSIQGNYVWNRNTIALVSSTPDGFYEQERGSRQNALIADLLVYFRNRRSWARPYLSAGTGVVSVSSHEKELRHSQGDLAVPPEQTSSTKPALRVAVGIDLRIRNGWTFRYTFSETIRSNPFSAMLTPPAGRGLANFQNLFGFFRQF